MYFWKKSFDNEIFLLISIVILELIIGIAQFLIILRPSLIISLQNLNVVRRDYQNQKPKNQKYLQKMS